MVKSKAISSTSVMMATAISLPATAKNPTLNCVTDGAKDDRGAALE